MTIKLPLIAAGLILASASAVLADSRSEIDARQARQLQKIEQGRRDGSITWTEGIRLRNEQRQIAKTEREALADGRLDRSERRELRELQNDASRHINSESNNSRERPGFLPRIGR